MTSEQKRIAELEKALRDIRNHCDAAIARGEHTVRVSAVLPLINKALIGGAS